MLLSKTGGTVLRASIGTSSSGPTFIVLRSSSAPLLLLLLVLLLQGTVIIFPPNIPVRRDHKWRGHVAFMSCTFFAFSVVILAEGQQPSRTTRRHKSVGRAHFKTIRSSSTYSISMLGLVVGPKERVALEESPLLPFVRKIDKLSQRIPDSRFLTQTKSKSKSSMMERHRTQNTDINMSTKTL
jgi:hypothetical protein